MYGRNMSEESVGDGEKGAEGMSALRMEAGRLECVGF